MRHVILGSILLCGLGASASAAPLIYEPFAYDATGNPELSTADGQVPGLWDKMAVGNPATDEPRMTAGNLSYPGLSWTPQGNSVAINGGGASSSSTRELPGQPYVSADEPTLYYSMIFQVTNMDGIAVGGANLTGGSFIAGFRSVTGTAAHQVAQAGAPLLIRGSDASATSYQLGTGLTAATTDRVFDTSNNYDGDDKLLLVLAYQFVSGGEDFARLYVNPDPNLSEAANASALKVTATATDGHGISGGQITNFFLRNNSVAPDGIQIDELRIAASWEDVMSVPEPGGLALLGLGGLALGARRRRR